jgi:uncharacterized membrane protein SpoIIM required for sporulation
LGTARRFAFDYRNIVFERLVENRSARIRRALPPRRRRFSDCAIRDARPELDQLFKQLGYTRARQNLSRRKPGNLVWKFLSEDFPQTFRRNIRYFAVAFGIFVCFAVIGFALTWSDMDFSQFVYADVREQVRAGEKWWFSLNEANQVGSSQILTNNILVTFRVFAMGAFFGIGAIYDLAFEGARLGSVFAVCYKIDVNFGNALATFVVGHGVIELSCIFICAGAGMMIGYAMINPGDLTRAQALKKKGLEAARIVVGCACLLVVAGIIEGFLSPSSLPPFVKVGTGVLTGIAMYSYLFLVGHEK